MIVLKRCVFFVFSSRALPQTTSLQLPPQPNLQTPFPPCSLLPPLVLLGTVPPPPRLRLSRRKSTCLQNLCFIYVAVMFFPNIVFKATLPSSQLSALISRGMLLFPWLYNNSVAWKWWHTQTSDSLVHVELKCPPLECPFSPVHCWTWIHCPLQVLQHHQLHLHPGEVSPLFPSDPKPSSLWTLL